MNTPPNLPLSEETFSRMIEEYSGGELADILRAMQGLPEENPAPQPESPWPNVVFYLSAAAVAITWIITHS